MPTRVANLFRSAAVTVEATPSLVDDALLFPEERAYLANAVQKRRAEFAAARLCARRALAALGIAPVPLVPHEDRAPLWPPGVVGSIAHSGDYCAVVVDRSPPALSVGLDVEKLRAFEPGMREMILTPRELAWLTGQPADLHDELTLVTFSAKEAYYKCQYPLSSRFLDFQDVELDLDLAAGRFEARALVSALPERVTRLAGKVAREGGMVFCGVELHG